MSATAAAGLPYATALLPAAQAALPDYLRDLAHLVSIDSGSYSPRGVNQVADWLQERLGRTGFTTERIASPPTSEGQAFGDTLVARKPGRVRCADGGRRILLAGHMDTVFSDGTAQERPFSLAGSMAYGPGVSDDKGGLLAGIAAVEILHQAGLEDFAEIVFLATPDEEVGSPASRPVTEAVADGMHHALALECARENGDLVIARKGVADFRITVTGRAAHAGIEPERGANAALAAAHLTVALQELNWAWEDVTVNVGVIRAGTRANIVCPEAELRVEVRAVTLTDIRRAEDAITRAAAKPGVPGTHVTVERLDLCTPMEDTTASRDMFHQARSAARAVGLDIGAAATGGVGDANFIAGTGVPVLDGLGPVGGADHSPQEWLDTTTVAPRTALLASLIASLGNSRPR
ncbi:M20 family metallopeptidase [Streptomyces sp. NPDC051577]|uniref:M20 family metallopeptidase n=1 Tax=Streptomyces sp. NPDC051577 TaxID=3155166 RepID=UPI00344ADBA8